MDLQELKNLAIKYLSYRPRSIAEVTKYLRSKTSDADLISQTLEFLKKFRLVDDEAFAKWLVESRSRSRPRGSRLLKRELKAKGIDISNSNYLPDREQESQLAFQALQKKLSVWSKLNYREFRLKSSRYLFSRGFSWDTIEQTIKRAYNQTHVNR